MTIILAFAFISGIITILSPCILPVLPIVLSGSVGGGKARPFGVVTGFILSFTIFTLALSALVQALGISPDALRLFAVVVLIAFGMVMLIPRLRDRFEMLAGRMANLGSKAGKTSVGDATSGRFPGFASGLPVGFSLGLVWTPCVGPIMASVISLAITQQVNGASVLITLAYTIGTAIPMLAVMIGGRALLNRSPGLTRRIAGIQRVFGVLMIIVGISIGFGWDRQFQSAILTMFPNYGTGLTALEDTDLVRNALDQQFSDGDEKPISLDTRPKNGKPENFGMAPELVAEGPWLNTNSEGFSMASLRGKVVLVDFWTYSCVNCVRTIPYLAAWYEEYHDQGFEIIGVHTPEFEFEKSTRNVEKAIEDLGVRWPVVQDNNFKQWRAYRNRYWPAHYFIDAEGVLRYFHFGEGKYDESEKVIRALLKEAGNRPTGKTVSMPDPSFDARTPETYLGFGRTEGFISNKEIEPNAVTDYQAARKPENGEWSLSGMWTVTKEYVNPEPSGALEIGFNAKNVFLVIEPADEEGVITVSLDGVQAEDTADVKDGILKPEESRLYQLVELDKPGEHVLRLEVQGSLRLFAFTFG